MLAERAQTGWWLFVSLARPRRGKGRPGQSLCSPTATHQNDRITTSRAVFGQARTFGLIHLSIHIQASLEGTFKGGARVGRRTSRAIDCKQSVGRWVEKDCARSGRVRMFAQSETNQPPSLRDNKLARKEHLSAVGDQSARASLEGAYWRWARLSAPAMDKTAWPDRCLAPQNKEW